MGQNKEIPSLPKKSVTPVIVTGIEALGRGNDLQKLREFIAEIAQLAQINPQIAGMLNPSDLLTRIATSLGIDTEGLVKSAEELQQEQEEQQQAAQSEQMMQMAEKAVAPAVSNMTKPR